MLLFAAGCQDAGEGAEINLGSAPEATAIAPSEPGPDVLILAVAAVNSPRSTLDAYEDLARYLGERLGSGSKLVSGKTYAEINSLVRSGDTTMAIVCSGAYVYGNAEFGMELLASPVIDGQQLYRSYLIVPASSSVDSWEDLQGKTFAFTDPLSNSGRIVPLDQVSRLGRTPETMFRKYIFTYSHDNSIKAVAHELVDAASVDSLVYDYVLATGQDDAAKTKVIWRSPAYAINPIVVNPGLDPDRKAALKTLLLDMHLDPEGARILDEMGIERFADADDRDYEPIREMISSADLSGLR